MVFKKPYAILIKYFKLIHIIITILMAYSIYKVSNLISFFNEYISSGWKSLNDIELGSYINPLIFIAIFVIILFNIIIYLLMRFKQKPRLYYMITPVIYILIFIVILVTNSILENAVADIISPITSRAIRDILLITIAIQFVFIIFSLLRAIGFDIKKFNFKKDIADLQITELDNEEIEVDFEVKKYKINRNLNRKLRNFTYIFLEHKFIWITLILIIFLTIVIIILYNMFVVNKTYKQNSIVQLDKYSIIVNDSFITNNDYKNSELSEKYKYLIVDTSIINKIKDNTFNIDNLSIESDKKIYSPINTGYSKLIDYGIGYTQGINLSIEKQNNYIFAFKIPKDEKISDVYLRYLYKTEYKDGIPELLYKRIKLSYKNYETTKLITKKLNQELIFRTNSLKINSFEYNDKFTYEYQVCSTDNNCQELSGNIHTSSSNSMTVLKLNVDLKLDNNDSAITNDNFGEFLENLAQIKYTKNDKTYIQKNIINLTPGNIDNKEIYLNVSKDIMNSKKVSIEFKHKGIKYIYIIKE